MCILVWIYLAREGGGTGGKEWGLGERRGNGGEGVGAGGKEGERGGGLGSLLNQRNVKLCILCGCDYGLANFNFMYVQ